MRAPRDWIKPANQRNVPAEGSNSRHPRHDRLRGGTCAPDRARDCRFERVLQRRLSKARMGRSGCRTRGLHARRRDPDGCGQARRPVAGRLPEPKLADVTIFLVRPQHAVGEMAAVGRIREGLRLQAEAGMRAVMRAVQSGNGAVQLGRVVDLNARLGAVQFERSGRSWASAASRSTRGRLAPRGSAATKLVS